jgi:hypothetical protein
MMETPQLVAALLSGLLLVPFLYWLLKPGEELARVTVVPGEPFEFTAKTGPHQKFSLWAVVDVTFKSLELTGPLAITQKSREVRTLAFALHPRGRTTEGSLSSITKSWLRGHDVARGSALVVRFKAQPQSTLLVRGTLRAGDTTKVAKLELYLTGG